MGGFGTVPDWIFSAPVLLLLGLCSLAMTLLRRSVGHYGHWLAVLVLLAAGFFATRAWTSLLRVNAAADLSLVLVAFGSWWLGRACNRSARLGQGFLFSLALLLLVNLYWIWRQSCEPGVNPWGLNHPNPDHLTGLFFHRNYFASFAAVTALILLSAGLWLSPWWLKISCFFLGLAAIVGVALSDSRGGVLALGAGMAVVAMASALLAFALRVKRYQLWLGLSVPAAMIAMVAGGYLLLGVLQQRGTVGIEGAFASNGRKETFWLALKMGGDGPAWGRGARSFEYESIPRWAESGLWQGTGNLNFVHNEFGQLLVDYGPLGLGLVLALLLVHFGLAIWDMARLRSRDLAGSAYRSWRPFWLCAGVAVLVASCLHANFSFIWHFPVLLGMVSLLAGALSSGCGVVAAEGIGGAVALWIQRTCLLVFTGLCLWLGCKGLGMQEHYWALNSQAESDERRLGLLGAAVEDFPDWRWQKQIAKIKWDEFRKVPIRETETRKLRLAEALEAYQKAKVLHPKEPALRLTLADLLSESGRFEQAEEEFRWVLANADGRQFWFKQNWIYSIHLYRWAVDLNYHRRFWEALSKLEQAKVELARYPVNAESYRAHRRNLDRFIKHLNEEVLPFYPRE